MEVGLEEDDATPAVEAWRVKARAILDALERVSTEESFQLFERMEDALTGARMTFDNVARTWLILDHILDWHAEGRALGSDGHQEFIQ